MILATCVSTAPVREHCSSWTLKPFRGGKRPRFSPEPDGGIAIVQWASNQQPDSTMATKATSGCVKVELAHRDKRGRGVRGVRGGLAVQRNAPVKFCM